MSKRVLRLARRKPLGAFGAVVIAAMMTLTVATPVFARYDPAQSFDRLNPTYDPSSNQLLRTDRNEFILDAKAAPSAKHWLGTDDAGRDIWSRLVWGTRRSLGIGVASMAIAVLAGTLLGVVSGYFSGLVDTTMQRLLDALQASAFVSSQRVRADGATRCAFGFTGMTGPRLACKVLTLRELPYIEAARHWRIDMRLMLRHCAEHARRVMSSRWTRHRSLEPASRSWA
jgi:ABC-type dipeptide/oligopeptide/nickel transport system permease subunit